MIKTLRRKFIMIAMLSTTLVLLLIIGGINISNYIAVNRSIDYKIDLIAENDGHFRDLPKGRHDRLPKEAPFDTRYFTVKLTGSGEVETVDTGQIFAIDTTTAASYATSLFDSNKTSGTIDDYKYKACRLQSSDSILYVFLDCEREFRTFHSFLFTSIGMSLIGLFLVFILVCIFSSRAVKPIAESYQKQKRFITDASHELKTPLTIIDANTEVIELTTGENEWTISTRNQVKRLASLTEKLVMLSRMDEENTTLERQNFCISDAVYDTAEPFLSVAKSKGKTFDIDVTGDIYYTGDEKYIRQLISLLLDNAMKYSSENGIIKLSLYEHGRNKIIQVYNTADDIPSGNLDVLFERFYRADESHNSKTGGFGIGLSVALAIVNAHKGRITVKSDDGKSILFTVTL